MDEVKIKTAFLKNTISKIITKEIRKKLNLDVDLKIVDLDISNSDDKYNAHFEIDGDLSMTQTQLSHILQRLV